MDFRMWLEQNELKKHLFLFDFDGTLVNTPSREEGSPRWQQSTGQPWSKAGWWGRKETLVPPIFHATPEDLKHDIVAEFHKAKADPDGYVVLMTGRHSGIKTQVKAILLKYGLHPDDEFYQGESRVTKRPDYPKNADTWGFKDYVHRNILAPREGLEQIDIWDDRVDHIPKWFETCQWIKTNYPNIKSIVFHDANTGEETRF